MVYPHYFKGYRTTMCVGLTRVDKLGYKSIDMHYYSQGQHERTNRVRGKRSQRTQLTGLMSTNFAPNLWG